MFLVDMFSLFNKLDYTNLLLKWHVGKLNTDYSASQWKGLFDMFLFFIFILIYQWLRQKNLLREKLNLYIFGVGKQYIWLRKIPKIPNSIRITTEIHILFNVDLLLAHICHEIQNLESLPICCRSRNVICFGLQISFTTVHFFSSIGVVSVS